MLRPFLSYQWDDKEFVHRVAEALVETGMEPILDEWYFVPGDPLTTSMNKAIKSASAFVLFWSESAKRSKNVEYEREVGLMETKERDDYRIVCVLLDDTKPPYEQLFRLRINWQKGKTGSKLFGQNAQKLARAIRGQSLVQPPRKKESAELCFIYATDFAALKSAMSVVGDRLESEPIQSPAGPFVTARIDRETEETLTRSESVWVYCKPHHTAETSKIKYIYVTQDNDVKRLEEIVRIEDARNLEATNLGLYVEADVSDQVIAQIQSLPSATVFDEPKHTLTDDDRWIHDQMQWSKRAALAAVSITGFESVEEFADAVTAEFQNICLVELTLKNVEVTVGDRNYYIHLTMSHHETATPHQGANTVNMNDIVKGMRVFVAADRNINPEDIDFSISPVLCTDGIVMSIEYAW